MILDSTGFRTVLEHRLAVAAVEFAIQQYSESRQSASVDERLHAAEQLFDATKQCWALLQATAPELPRIGPVGVA